MPIFRFLLFLQGFHNWTLNPFHMMGVQVFWEGLFIHGVTVENTLYEDGEGRANTFKGAPVRPRRRDLFDGYINRFWSQIFRYRA